MEPGTTLPNAWAAILAAISSVTGLLLSETLIDNHTAKLVTGLATILFPIAYMIANAMHHQAKARVKAAEMTAGRSGTQIGR